jgi:hypothetical protein
VEDFALSDEEWGPWIEHDGSGCPVVGKLCQMEFTNPFYSPVGHVDEDGTVAISRRVAEGVAIQAPAWGGDMGLNLILRYRIRQPRTQAHVEALKDIAADPSKLREAAET